VPNFEDFRQPPEERTPTQRVVTYGAAAAIAAIVSVLLWSGVWDFSDTSSGKGLYALAPFACVFFLYRVWAELKSTKHTKRQ
jgi:hypothetical protein